MFTYPLIYRASCGRSNAGMYPRTCLHGFSRNHGQNLVRAITPRFVASSTASMDGEYEYSRCRKSRLCPALGMSAWSISWYIRNSATKSGTSGEFNVELMVILLSEYRQNPQRREEARFDHRRSLIMGAPFGKCRLTLNTPSLRAVSEYPDSPEGQGRGGLVGTIFTISGSAEGKVGLSMSFISRVTSFMKALWTSVNATTSRF